MFELEHIDLTENKRFERIIETEERDLQNKVTDRGIHRLKRGEIPHFTYGASPKITVHRSSTLSTLTSWSTTNIDLSEYVVSLDNAIINNDYTVNSTITSAVYSWTVNDWGVTTSDSGNTAVWYTNNNWNSLVHVDSDSKISDRIKHDPFFDRVYRSDSIGSRLSSNYTDDHDNLLTKKDDIRHRMDDADVEWRRLKPKVTTFPSTIESRLEDADDRRSFFHRIMHELGRSDWATQEFKHPDNLLKERAPFIKRVYVTNAGRSFDSKELSLDMAIAAEHFNSAVEVLY